MHLNWSYLQQISDFILNVHNMHAILFDCIAVFRLLVITFICVSCYIGVLFHYLSIAAGFSLTFVKYWTIFSVKPNWNMLFQCVCVYVSSLSIWTSFLKCINFLQFVGINCQRRQNMCWTDHNMHTKTRLARCGHQSISEGSYYSEALQLFNFAVCASSKLDQRGITSWKKVSDALLTFRAWYHSASRCRHTLI